MVVPAGSAHASRAQACGLVAPAVTRLDAYNAWDSYTRATAADLQRAIDDQALALAFSIAVLFGRASESYPGAARDWTERARVARQEAQAAYDQASASRTAAWQQLGSSLVAVREAARSDYGQSDADTEIWARANEAVGSPDPAAIGTKLSRIAEICATAPPLDPCRAVPLWAETARPTHDEITRLYQAVFGRAPDSSGLAYWVEQRSRGASLVTLAGLFATSAEWSARYGSSPNPEQVVAALYGNVLGRAPDPGGLSYWVGRINSGWTVAQVLVGFSESPENVTLTGTTAPTTSIEGKVYRLYRAVFGRQPDRCGFAYWKWRLESGDPIQTIAAGFTQGAEWRARYGSNISHELLVQRLYENVLGRPPDAAGSAYWTGVLQAGAPVAQVLVSFSESVENIVRTGTVP